MIEPRYLKTSSKCGRPPYPLATMLCIHLLQRVDAQQWYDLSDPAMEGAQIEVSMMRRFAGMDMISEWIPDEPTILAFRRVLEKHGLGEWIYCFPEDFVYEAVKAPLRAKGMAMKQGTIIDATLIAVPSSTLTRVKSECAGGTRTKLASAIRRSARPARASSGTSGCSRRPPKR